MSKGSPRTTLRIPAELLRQIQEAIDRQSEFRRGEPWNMTTWIIAAIRERLDKQARGRRPKAKAGEPE